MNPLLTFSATKLAEMIRTREVSSTEVVEAHIRQIENVNPTLNAVVAERFVHARREAARADQQLADKAAPELYPFWGVPCTIKECFALAGMPNTAGLVARVGQRATSDALTVARLRQAGAIPLGVTNTSELCMWMESNNCVYGRTNNPYDPRRIAGGSSGGEGAIIGAAGSPFGLGSDIGGSIRMPAFFNGIFGHKPTGGLVPNQGQFPRAENAADRYLTTGPLARRAEDLLPLLRVLSGEAALGDAASVDIKQLHVLDCADNGAVAVSDDLRQAQQKAANALARLGARVESVRFDGLRRSFEIWSAMLAAAGGASFATLLGEGKAINRPYEILRWLLGLSPHTFPALGLALIEGVPKLLRKRAAKLVEEGMALRHELATRIGRAGVMLYPSYASPAPMHNQPLWPPLNWSYTAIINALELPSTQVPLGLNRAGLPLGVQVVGSHGCDHVTIAVALVLEREFGGWVPPLLATQAGTNSSPRAITY